MKKELKKAYKKLAKYEKKLQDTHDVIVRLRINADMNRTRANEAERALKDLKNALQQKDITAWYEKRINDLEEMLSDGVTPITNYGSMIAQNKAFSKEVRELRLRVYGRIKKGSD